MYPELDHSCEPPQPLVGWSGPRRHSTSAERVIGKGPKAGQTIQVNTPDHVSGTMEFVNGAAGTLMTSFAVTHGLYDRKHPIVIYGTDGALKVPEHLTEGLEGLPEALVGLLAGENRGKRIVKL